MCDNLPHELPWSDVVKRSSKPDVGEMPSPRGNNTVTFSALFAPYAPFGVVQAPLFIWLAAVGLVVGTFVFLVILQSLARRERHLYERITRDLRSVKSKHGPAPRNGFPQAAYDELVQCFETTSLAPVWEIFAAQLVVRVDATGTDCFW